MPQKKQFQTEDLFNDSEDDNDIFNSVKESCINYSTDFDKWTVHHYYAMKKREEIMEETKNTRDTQILFIVRIVKD